MPATETGSDGYVGRQGYPGMFARPEQADPPDSFWVEDANVAPNGGYWMEDVPAQVARPATPWASAGFVPDEQREAVPVREAQAREDEAMAMARAVGSREEFAPLPTRAAGPPAAQPAARVRRSQIPVPGLRNAEPTAPPEEPFIIMRARESPSLAAEEAEVTGRPLDRWRDWLPRPLPHGVQARREEAFDLVMRRHFTAPETENAQAADSPRRVYSADHLRTVGETPEARERGEAAGRLMREFAQPATPTALRARRNADAALEADEIEAQLDATASAAEEDTATVQDEAETQDDAARSPDRSRAWQALAALARTPSTQQPETGDCGNCIVNITKVPEKFDLPLNFWVFNLDNVDIPEEEERTSFLPHFLQRPALYGTLQDQYAMEMGRPQSITSPSLSPAQQETEGADQPNTAPISTRRVHSVEDLRAVRYELRGPWADLLGQLAAQSILDHIRDEDSPRDSWLDGMEYVEQMLEDIGVGSCRQPWGHGDSDCIVNVVRLSWDRDLALDLRDLDIPDTGVPEPQQGDVPTPLLEILRLRRRREATYLAFPTQLTTFGSIGSGRPSSGESLRPEVAARRSGETGPQYCLADVDGSRRPRPRTPTPPDIAALLEDSQLIHLPEPTTAGARRRLAEIVRTLRGPPNASSPSSRLDLPRIWEDPDYAQSTAHALPSTPPAILGCPRASGGQTPRLALSPTLAARLQSSRGPDRTETATPRRPFTDMDDFLHFGRIPPEVSPRRASQATCHARCRLAGPIEIEESDRLPPRVLCTPPSSSFAALSRPSPDLVSFDEADESRELACRTTPSSAASARVRAWRDAVSPGAGTTRQCDAFAESNKVDGNGQALPRHCHAHPAPHEPSRATDCPAPAATGSRAARAEQDEIIFNGMTSARHHRTSLPPEAAAHRRPSEKTDSTRPGARATRRPLAEPHSRAVNARVPSDSSREFPLPTAAIPSQRPQDVGSPDAASARPHPRPSGLVKVVERILSRCVARPQELGVPEAERR